MADTTTTALSVTNIIVLVCVIALGFLAMGLFNWRNHFPVDGTTVLITGASQGMGKSVAKFLSKKGANIIIVARDVKKMEETLSEIRASAKSPTAQRFHLIAADLEDPASAPRVISEATTWNNNNPPDIVWCIAGACYPDLYLSTPPSRLRQQMNLNYFAAADIAHAILTSWLSPTHAGSLSNRHLIFTGSTLAFYTIAGYSPYSPAKAAVRSLCDTLAQEVLLYSDSVKLHMVFPGSIDSPGYANENLTKPAVTKMLEESDPLQSADEVASKAIKGLENGEYFITVGILGRMMRAASWGASRRGNWLVELILAGIMNLVWVFVAWDMDGKTRSFGKKHGHPSTYAKTS